MPPAPGGQPRPNKRGLIALLAVLALVVVLAIGGGIYMLVGGPAGDGFDVGSCIQEGTGEPISCDQKGAYKIVKRVDDADKCPDPKAPKATVDDSDVVLCLQKVK